MTLSVDLDLLSLLHSILLIISIIFNVKISSQKLYHTFTNKEHKADPRGVTDSNPSGDTVWVFMSHVLSTGHTKLPILNLLGTPDLTIIQWYASVQILEITSNNYLRVSVFLYNCRSILLTKVCGSFVVLKTFIDNHGAVSTQISNLLGP